MSTPRSGCERLRGRAEQPVRVYGLDLTYDTIHNITRKNQLDTRYPPGNSNGVVQKKVTSTSPTPTTLRRCLSTAARADHIGCAPIPMTWMATRTGWTQRPEMGQGEPSSGTTRTAIQSIADNGSNQDYKYDDQASAMIKRGRRARRCT